MESNLKIIERILIFLSLTIYVVALPPFLKDQTLSGHDTGAHLTYIRLFTDALNQGQFPVRWIEWSLPGLNQPLFSYYPSLDYYIVQIPHIFGLDLLNSMNLTILFLWIFSGFFIYLFVKNLTKVTLAGVAAALIYVFAPYHILDVLVRSAYPEITALFFIPGVFWALERVFATGLKKYVGFLALFFAAVYVSHPPTLLMFTFPIFLFSCYLIYKNYQTGVKNKILFEKLKLSLIAIVLGLGLSAYFWIPQITGQNLINYQHLNSGYSDYHLHFVCLKQLFTPNWGYGLSDSSCNDNLSYQIGITNLIVIFTTLLSLAYFLLKRIKFDKALMVTFLLTAAFGAYMTMSISLPFWTEVPYMSIVQFPWRFLSVVIFSAAILAGLLFTYLSGKKQLILFVFLGLITPIFIFSFLSPFTYLSRDYFMQDSKNFYNNKNAYAVPEVAFMPKSAQVLPDSKLVPISEIEAKGAKIKVVKNEFIYKKYIVSASKDTKVTIYTHYFPGWKFYVNDKEIKVNYSNIFGFSSFNLEPGEYKVVAKFSNTPLISFSNFLSITSLIVVFFLFYPFLFKGFKRV